MSDRGRKDGPGMALPNGIITPIGTKEQRARYEVAEAPRTNEPALLPQNVEAEQGVLGGVQIKAEAIKIARKRLFPRDFYKSEHRMIFQAMCDLDDRGEPADGITLVDYLREQGLLEAIGGKQYLSELVRATPTAENVDFYAKIVQRDSIRRTGVSASAMLADTAYQRNVEDILPALRVVSDTLREEAERIEGRSERLRLKTIQDIRERPRPEWLVRGMFQERKLWLVYGDSNTGKSFFAQDFGMTLSLGGVWFGHQLPAMHVIYVCAEGADGLRDRLDAWMATHGVDDLPNFHIIDESANLLDGGDVDTVIAACQELGEAPAVVILDTLAESMPGGDENGPEDMGVAIAAIRRIQRELACAVLTVHHSGKDATKGPRGNSKLRAAMDTAMEVTKEEGSDIFTVTCRKARDAAYFPAFSACLKPILDPVTLQPLSCVVEPSDADVRAVSKPRRQRQPTAKDKVLQLITEKPDSYGHLKSRFIEQFKMSGESFEKAIQALYDAKEVNNFGGFYRLYDDAPIEQPSLVTVINRKEP